MSVLALKALDYGADKLPDKLFEAIPGGFFTPAEKRHAKSKTNRRPLRENKRGKSEQRDDRSRRRSQRERTPPSEYSGHSSYDDTDYERDQRRQGRSRRGKSLGRSPSRSLSRSLSRGRHDRSARRNHRSSFDGQDAEYEPRAMDRERGDREPQFPPPPTAEYRPYNPQEYASPPPATGGHYDAYQRRPASARQDPGYTPQPISHTAARYTPGPDYAPSPSRLNEPIPPPPTAAYAPYNPADYADQGYHAPGNAYPSPPPFYRQSSRSQPSLDPYPANQIAAYDTPPDRHGSTSSSRHHRHRNDKRNRARSAGHHGRSRSRVTDKFRDRFEDMDLNDKNLAASVGGALAGGVAGRALGHGTLSTLIGAGIGAIGGREFEKRHDKKKNSRSTSRPKELRDRSRSRSRRGGDSRSPSHDRKRDARYSDDDSFSDASDSDSRRGTRRRKHRSRRDPDY